jgi:hypothetical protein
MRIHELPVKKFDGDTIDNCFYVENPYAPVYRVEMSELFDWIKEKAITAGLTVELKDNNLIFISEKETKDRLCAANKRLIDKILDMYVPDGNPEIWIEKIIKIRDK